MGKFPPPVADAIRSELTDNIYYRNVNNNSGIFNYIIGEAEEQDWKEALLAYYGLLTAAAPLTREALGARIEELLARAFGVSADFEIDDALARLKGLDLVGETDRGLSAVPLAGRAGAARQGVAGVFRRAAGGPHVCRLAFIERSSAGWR